MDIFECRSNDDDDDNNKKKLLLMLIINTAKCTDVHVLLLLVTPPKAGQNLKQEGGEVSTCAGIFKLRFLVQKLGGGSKSAGDGGGGSSSSSSTCWNVVKFLSSFSFVSAGLGADEKYMFESCYSLAKIGIVCRVWGSTWRPHHQQRDGSHRGARTRGLSAL